MVHRAHISLRSLIFLVLAISVSTPVLLYGYSRSLRVESEVLARIDLSNKIATERNSDRIETLISSRIEVMQVLSGTLATIDNWEPTQLQQLAKATVESVDAVQYLLIADAGGVSQVFYPSRHPGHLAGISYNDRSYVQRLRATNKPVVSEVIMGRSSGVAQIAIATPVMSPSATLRGFVTATVPIATLLETILETTDADLGQRILVLDASNQVLVDTNDVSLASLQSMSSAPFLVDRATTLAEGAVVTRDERGESVRLARLPIRFPGAPWSVWSMVPQVTIDVTLAAERDTVLQSTAIAILFSFLFVLIVSRAITLRVKGLERLALKIGRGELEQRFGPAPFWVPAELEILRATSNSTLSDLESSVAQRENLIRTIAEKGEAMEPLVAAWDHVGDAIEFTDPAGRILFENPTAKTRRATSPGSRRRISMLFTEVESVKEMMSQLHGGVSWRGSINYENNKGNRTHEDVTASPILDADGTLIRVIIIWTDVSGAVQQKERASRNERLVALGTMAATVAHEINNPLTYVKANIDDVREQLSGVALPNSVDLLECLDDARQGTDRVAVIVARMLRLVRSEESEDVRCRLETVVQSAADVTGNAIRHRATLTTEIEGAGWVRIRDSSLFQVLVNLLNNAAQAIPLSGEEKHTVRITAQRSEQWVEILVSDTGSGMTTEQKQNAFDPFFTTKPVGEGTGLGLPLAKSMIESAGGTISVESTPGVGTTFTIRLETMPDPHPEDSSPTASPAPESSSTQRQIRGRILIIDDEEAVARAIGRMLAEHEVEICTSAAEALDLLGKIRFDVVLSDVMMPQLNGYELYQRAVAQDPALHDSWIFMSGGMFGGETASRIQETGCALIEKPIDSNLLRRTILQQFSPSTGHLH